MPSTITSTALSAAIAAAAAAPNGSKNSAYLSSLVTSLGGGYKTRLFRNGVEVVTVTHSGTCPIAGNALAPADAGTTNTITTADIDSGTWTHRLTNSDGTMYIETALTKTGGAGPFFATADTDSAGAVAFGSRALSVSLDTSPPAGGDPVPVGVPGSWFLTFRDEFDSATLNSSAWNTAIWYGDDNGANAVVNYDTNNGGNSCLRIWPALGTNGQFFNRTIDTDGKYYQTYGYFEARMKAPRGLGLFPAFWLFDHPGSQRPEIDIAEWYPGGVGGNWAASGYYPHDYGATVHYPGIFASDGPYRLVDVYGAQRLDTAFHVYGCEWTSSQVIFYFDGRRLATSNRAINQRMYLMLDLWYGSASGTPVTNNDSITPKGSTNSFEIDYVRAWRRA